MDRATGPFPVLVGGSACLDFVNTLDDRVQADPVEHLGSHEALVAWCRHADLLDEAEARHLAARARRERGAAGAALARAREVREALYGVLAAVAGGRPVPGDPLRLVNGAIAELSGPPQ